MNALETRSRGYALLFLPLLVAALWGGYAALASGGLDEDAAMVLRYATNVARGHGIVWNVGEPPVDGATDLLFMLMVAASIKLGGAPEQSARWLGVGCHLATVILVFASARRAGPGNRWAPYLSALFVALGPGAAYISTGFGTCFFALCVAFAWFFAVSNLHEPPTPGEVVRFAVAAFLLAVARPEGCFIAIAMLLGVALVADRRRVLSLSAALGGAYCIGGALYILWRYEYFGHWLPLPFLRKGGVFRVASLSSSFLQVLLFAGPFIAFIAYGLRARRTRAVALMMLVPLFCATFMWSFLSTAQNVFGRFQYPVIFPALMSWPALLVRPSSNAEARSAWRHVLVLAALTLGVVGFWGGLARLPSQITTPRYEGTRSAAHALADLAGPDYVVATSEAGMLPFYTQWRALDAWGLNDYEITTQGLTEDRLERLRPHLVMFNQNAPGYNLPELELDRSWLRMTHVLQAYAESHGYYLAAVFCGNVGIPSADFYYVRPDFPGAKAMRDRIRNLEYSFFGTRWLNYATGEGHDLTAAAAAACPAVSPHNTAQIDRTKSLSGHDPLRWGGLVEDGNDRLVSKEIAAQ